MTTSAGTAVQWLRSPMWDGFWLLSGLWLLIPIAIVVAAPLQIEVVLIPATLVLWLSHRFATTYSAFCTPTYRKLVRNQWLRFVLFPALLLTLVILFVYLPDAYLPLTLLQRTLVLGSIFYLYNTYHFGVQHYGVFSIYRIRAGQSPQSSFKRYEKFLALTVGGVVVAVGQILHGAIVVMDSMIYGFVPPVLGETMTILRPVVVILVVALTGWFIYRERREDYPSVPKTLYVVGLAIQGIAAYFLAPLVFLFLWGVQHWLVSVALAGRMAENDTSAAPESSLWYRFWGVFNRGFWPTVGVLALISVILTPFFDYVLHSGSEYGGEAVSAYLHLVLVNDFIIRLFIVLSFWTVFLHFVMDRAVFRFSDPRVRSVTGPLLFKPSV